MTNTIFGSASRHKSKESFESSAIKTKSRWIWGEREKVSTLREMLEKFFRSDAPESSQPAFHMAYTELEN